ncbi:PRTRC system protein C [Lamprocystis purpurea]|jgi:PRTRC genetic system protein C|uniref:PRTRC system protein C n=1 Tax=Lamprocystis purpurea TaxID=61598 RepID=UPI000360C6BA|nr:PRTRC system protein C [Lamprocystis purpurea]
MTEPTIETPPRVFRLGALELADPDPALAAEDALALYAPNFPQVQGANLGAPESRADGVLVFPVERAAVKTKG